MGINDLNFKFKMPSDETLAKYIPIKGEKGERGDPTKTSQLENDSDFTTNAALNSGLATKADKTTVQSLTTQVNANTSNLAAINATKIAKGGGTASSVYYYELCQLNGYSEGTSVIHIHGRIGGYGLNVDEVDFMLSASQGDIGAKGDYFTTTAKSGRLVNFVVYYDETTEKTKLYFVGKSWFYVQFTMEISGQTTQTYDGAYSSTTPSGTLLWSFQDDNNIQTNYNGVIHGDIDGDAQTVNNHTVDADVPYGAVFTDTVYDDTAIRDELDLKANTADVSNTYATKEELRTIVSNSPIPVSSTSEMTDTTKIYVNTTDGYWYYYSGSEWVQGGQYQATENSDVVNGLVFNQIKENLKYLMGFAVGNISSGGVVVDSNNWLITSNILKFNYDIYIPCNDYVKTDLYTYEDDGTYIRYYGRIANANKGHIIRAGTNFRLRLVYVNEPSPLPNLKNDTVENSQLFQHFIIMPFSVYRNNQLFKLRANGYQENPENLKYLLDLQIGDINNSGADFSEGAHRRLFTENILRYDYDIVLPKTDTYMVYLWTYTAQDGSGASGQGWKYLSSEALTIAAGTYFRLLFVTDRNSTAPLYDIYDNDVFKGIEVYKKSESVEPVTVDIIRYNPNMRSVAHQGYSTTSQAYGNCRLSSYLGAKQHGFDYAECDLQWTSEMIPVCCHDASFASNGQTIVITEHTLAELKTYDFYGETIASFEEVLAKCKTLGLGLYIDKAWFDQTHFNIMAAIVDKYQMQDNVYWLLQGAIQPTFNMISNWYPNAKYSVVLNTGSTAPTDAQITAVVDFANNNKTANNYISIDVNHNHFTTAQMASLSARLTNGVQLECWTIDNTTRYKEVLPYLCGITSNKICYNDVYEDLLS